jgi:putative membrane protein
VVWALVAAAIATQIAYPLTGAGHRDALTIVSVLVFCAASLTHAAVTRGVRTAALVLAVTAGGGLVAETAGVGTGLPFGEYHYTGSLGPRILGVPVVIPLAWTMMAWPAWLAAGRLTAHPTARVLLAGWALASWDFFLDPQMVAAGQWVWEAPGSALPLVPAVPLTNYLGWAVVAVALAAALMLALPADRSAADGPMYALYLWTYFSSVLAHLAFLGLPGSALWGGLAMGTVALPLAVRLMGDR